MSSCAPRCRPRAVELTQIRINLHCDETRGTSLISGTAALLIAGLAPACVLPDSSATSRRSRPAAEWAERDKAYF